MKSCVGNVFFSFTFQNSCNIQKLQIDFYIYSNPEMVGHKAAWLCIVLSWRTGKLSN